jgi:hypothetical protein
MIALKLNSELLILMEQTEHDRLQELFQLAFARMHTLLETGAARMREEIQKMAEPNTDVQYDVFEDNAVGGYMMEIRDILIEVGWRHVSGDFSVLQGMVLDHIFKTVSATCKAFYPIIATVNNCACYAHHDFQRLFLDTCRERKPHDGSLLQKELCDPRRRSLYSPTASTLEPP